MFDPFEPDSLLKHKELKQHRVLLWIFVPLFVFAILSCVSMYMAWQALEYSYVHPECACKRILKDNRNLEFEKPVFAVA